MENIETKIATIAIDKKGIVHIKIKRLFGFTEEESVQYVNDCLRIADDKKRKILFDISEVNNLTPNAMKKLLDPRLSALTIACACIVGLRSPLVSMAMSILMKFDKEPFPLKIFTTEKEAMQWLDTFP